MIAEIDYADQALGKILPLRDTFACLFFASIGMLIDPSLLATHLGLILGLVMVIMVGKAAIILPIVLRFGYSLKTAVLASFGLNQIGEFSFVLALVGLQMELITPQRYSLLSGHHCHHPAAYPSLDPDSSPDHYWARPTSPGSALLATSTSPGA
jgi:CPA2 family monovalent cation:H+ antiporter-2